MTYKLAAIVMAAVLSTACLAQAPVGSVGGSGSVNDRLAELERAFNARSQAQITQHNQLNALQREVSELRGTLEEQGYRLEQVIDRQKDILLKLQDLEDQPQAAAPAKPTVSGDAKSASSANKTNGAANSNVNPATSSTTTAHGNEQAAYDHAVNLVLQDKDFDAAIPAFARFITQYPESAYVPNSHYWLGQLLFTKKRFDQSKAQFSRVVDAYPKSTKRAESLLKLGLIAQQQKDTAAARTYLEQVLNEYGSSSSAALAKKTLDEL